MNIIDWLIFGGGVIIGGLLTLFFTSLKIKGLKNWIGILKSRIKILERNLEMMSKEEE